MSETFTYRFRAPYGPPEEKQGKPPVYRREIKDGLLIEWDVPVAMRDGARIYIDVFRPVDELPAPVLIGWGPYGKHGHTNYSENFPNCGVKPEHFSEYCAFEAPDPRYWVAHGYAIINADKRGNWYSEGDATFLSPEEALDFHDLIEWAGTQAWSNGKVGLSGVSYLTCSQWRVAETNPPHQPLGRLGRYLPGGGAARRYPGDLVLGLPARQVGSQFDPYRGPAAGNEGTAAVRRLLGIQGL